MSNLIALARDIWHREPARVSAVVVYVVLFAASKAGIVLDPASTAQYVFVALGLLLGAEGTRKKVVPLKNIETSPDSLPADNVSRP